MSNYNFFPPKKHKSKTPDQIKCGKCGTIKDFTPENFNHAGTHTNELIKICRECKTEKSNYNNIFGKGKISNKSIKSDLEAFKSGGIKRVLERGNA